MRSKFGKKAIATGVIAAFGINIATTSAAFAAPGHDQSRRYSDNDTRGRQDGQGWDRQRRSNSHDTRAVQNGRHDNNRGRNHRNDREQRAGGRHDQSRHARGDRHGNRGPSAPANHHGYAKGHAKGQPHGAPVRIVRRPVVVNKTTVVKQPVAVHRTVVHNAPAPRHPRGRYGPPPTRVVVVPERRRYRNVVVARDYGHRYHGYGHYNRDDDAYKWLAFTAITVAIINNLTVSQQRAYEDAQIRATTAPVGDTIHWNDGGAYGTVTATRDGTSSLNRYCREFQKTVTIGGRTEQAYGTACMQPDGAWEVVSNSYD